MPSEEGFLTPGTGATSSCELSHVGAILTSQFSSRSPSHLPSPPLHVWDLQTVLCPNAKSEVVLNPNLTGEEENVYKDRLKSPKLKMLHRSSVCVATWLPVNNSTAGFKDTSGRHGENKCAVKTWPTYREQICIKAVHIDDVYKSYLRLPYWWDLPS